MLNANSTISSFVNKVYQPSFPNQIIKFYKVTAAIPIQLCGNDIIIYIIINQLKLIIFLYNR
ncbi:hypothetical protein AN1V17_50290 [Vallitalea sediminicola]